MLSRPARPASGSRSPAAAKRRRDLDGTQLAHGDFDTTPILQVDGRYRGLIDFGEIRGAEPLFDLGHFLLHDQEHTPIPLLDDLLAGYGEVVPLLDGHEELVRRSAAVLGLRQLARRLGPVRILRPDHPAATVEVEQPDSGSSSAAGSPDFRSTFAPSDVRPRGMGRYGQVRQVTAEAGRRLFVHVTGDVRGQGGDRRGPARSHRCDL
jgi:Phosphotransferase enzyme family